jgi:crotonobetainyl-CoA:carnitine CoA-transferase CaiB-like acyl-CoA transferase
MPAASPLRVVEFSRGVAAAYCGKLLAEAGAEVNVVRPPGAHPLEQRRPHPGAAPGALHAFLTGPKQVVDADEAASLLTGADVLIDEGGKPDQGGSRFPGVRVSFTPFGLDGPWRDRPANEFILQAMTGSIAKRGLPGRPPVYSGGAPIDFVAGSYGAAAVSCFILAAGPVHLDVSLLEAGAVTMHAFMTIDASFRGAPLWRSRRTMIPSIEPTADGYVGFSTITAQQFTDFLMMIGRPDMATTAEIVETATALRIPVAPIGEGRNLPENDHLRQRGVFAHGTDGLLRPRRPWLVRGTDAANAAHAVPTSHEPWSGPPPGSPPDRPLSGLRVADLTAFWAGPAATHVLAALGADVVKVESPKRPDGMRFTSVRPGEPQWLEWSPVFHGVNANKRSVALDLHDDADRRAAEKLIEWCDVVIENFSPRVLDDLGLGEERIRALNPAAVLVRMPAFGLDGPWRDRTGFAMTVEQASGMAWQTGYSDGPPMDVGGVCDPMGGMHAVVALMSALRDRAATGKAAVVEVPLFEVALNAAAEQIVQYSLDGTLVVRDSNRGPDGAPQGVYQADREDTWVAVSIRDDEEWQRLCPLIGEPAWADDPRLGTVEARRAAHDTIDGRLADWCSLRPAAESVEMLVEAGIPAAEAVLPAMVAANPQLVARRFDEVLDHPVTGRHAIPSLPFRLAGTPAAGWYRAPAPTVGQHSDEIRREILDPDRLPQESSP